ncbi:MAG TPA: hypothetical protein PKJ47_00735 [Candidatus Limiplasma sp.]|nr:hypothetical protein [Candidatus Limiplasma sp.]
MKKWLSLWLCAALALTVSAGLAQQADSGSLQGLITEVGESSLVMNDLANGAVRVILEEGRTVYKGNAEKASMAVGQYVFVRYSGAMTGDNPPQATADTVECYWVKGTVSEILQNGYVVKGDSVLGTVMVHTDAQLAPVFLNVPITVYYSGIMALSMPPQIEALQTVVPVLEGVASKVAEDGFVLTDDQGVAHRIMLNAQTQLVQQPADGLSVCVYFNGEPESAADVTALEITGVLSAGDAEAAASKQ